MCRWRLLDFLFALIMVDFWDLWSESWSWHLASLFRRQLKVSFLLLWISEEGRWHWGLFSLDVWVFKFISDREQTCLYMRLILYACSLVEAKAEGRLVLLEWRGQVCRHRIVQEAFAREGILDNSGLCCSFLLEEFWRFHTATFMHFCSWTVVFVLLTTILQCPLCAS